MIWIMICIILWKINMDNNMDSYMDNDMDNNMDNDMDSNMDNDMDKTFVINIDSIDKIIYV